MLVDDSGYPCKEIRVFPLGGEGNILCGFKGYQREIAFRRYRNLTLGDKEKFLLPEWEDLEVYDKEK